MLIRSLQLVIICSCLILPELGHAIVGNTPAVILVAPKEVRMLLDEHFVLPEKTLKDENERAIFMRRAQREIPELLTTEGFFSSKVNLRSISQQGDIELDVIPGKRTLVTEVKIEFSGDLSLQDIQRSRRVQQLRDNWLLPLGKPFRSADWDEAKADLIARVADKDYASARLAKSSAQVDPTKASARLHLVLDSGPRFLFGELQVSGLERYERLLVTRYATFSSGEPYQRDLLLSFQAQLQNLPQFSSVIVNFDTTLENAQTDVIQGTLTAPVKVRIVEAQSRRISVGIGYSSNNGVRNGINYQSYNFLNQAWTLSSAAVMEQNRQTFSIGLDTPPNPLGYHLVWKGSGEKTQIQGLDTIRDKFGVARLRTLFGIETGIGLYWQQEKRLPQGGIRETDQVLVLDWQWNRRNVDNPLFPMSGGLTELRIGGASKVFQSDQNFVRSYARHQIWIALTEQDVFSLRVEGGYTVSTSRLGIPQEYLFRVGGTQTVRGFAYQSLGFVEGDAVVGGRVMATGSADYTHWVNNWGVALFSDVGGAADVAPELNMSLGYGIGARWRSPLGPLALDLAQGKGEPDLRLHFSIAVAF